MAVSIDYKTLEGNFGKKFGKVGARPIRVLYVDLVIHEKVYLITAYTKNQKDNLSNEEKAIVKKMIEQLKDEADRGGKK